MAKFETLVSDFSSEVTNGTGRFVSYGRGAWPAAANIVSEQLQLTVNSAYSGALISADTYDLTDSFVQIEVVQRPAQGGDGSTEMSFGIRYANDDQNAFEFLLTGGGALGRRTRQGGTTVQNYGLSYNATTMKFLRFEESGGSVLFRYGPSAEGPWTTMYGFTPTIDIDEMELKLASGFWGTQATPGFAIFDNLNLAIPLPKMETLVDDFSTQDTDKWSGWGANSQVSGGQLVITTASNYSGNLLSVDAYDLTESFALIEVIQRPTQGGDGSTQAFFAVRQEGIAGETNYFEYVLNGTGTLVWNQREGGTLIDSGWITYNPATMRWLRILHHAGSIWLECKGSLDDPTWQVLDELTPGIDITSMQAFFMTGFWGTQASPGSFIVDNFNVMSSVTIEDAEGDQTLSLTQSATGAVVAEATGSVALVSAASATAELVQGAAADQSLGLEHSAEAKAIANAEGSYGIDLDPEGTAEGIADAEGSVEVILSGEATPLEVGSVEGQANLLLSSIVTSEVLVESLGGAGLTLNTEAEATSVIDAEGSLTLSMGVSGSPETVLEVSGTGVIEIVPEASAREIHLASAENEINLISDATFHTVQDIEGSQSLAITPHASTEGLNLALGTEALDLEGIATAPLVLVESSAETELALEAEASAEVILEVSGEESLHLDPSAQGLRIAEAEGQYELDLSHYGRPDDSEARALNDLTIEAQATVEVITFAEGLGELSVSVIGQVFQSWDAEGSQSLSLTATASTEGVTSVAGDAALELTTAANAEIITEATATQSLITESFAEAETASVARAETESTLEGSATVEVIAVAEGIVELALTAEAVETIIRDSIADGMMILLGRATGVERGAVVGGQFEVTISTPNGFEPRITTPYAIEAQVEPGNMWEVEVR